MKKLIALALAAVMLASCAASALAEIDLDHLIQGMNNGLITLSQDASGADLYMETTLPRTTFRFEHPFTHPAYFSATEFDVLILDYATAEAMPVLRLWIRYFGTQFMNIEAVSFVIDGVAYRFDGISSPDRRQLLEGKAYAEVPGIIFGADHLPFLEALLAHGTAVGTVAELDANPIKMILHGDQDYEVVLGSGFVLDFLGVWSYYVNSGCGNYIYGIQGSPMTVQ